MSRPRAKSSRTKPAPAREAQDTKALLEHLFRGRRIEWLPLFHRLIARMTQVPSTGFDPRREFVALMRTEAPRQEIGKIWISPDGLRLGLRLARAAIRSPRLQAEPRGGSRLTHSIAITQASDIDTELLTFIKAAHHQARTSKRRST